MWDGTQVLFSALYSLSTHIWSSHQKSSGEKMLFVGNTIMVIHRDLSLRLFALLWHKTSESVVKTPVVIFSTNCFYSSDLYLNNIAEFFLFSDVGFFTAESTAVILESDVLVPFPMLSVLYSLQKLTESITRCCFILGLWHKLLLLSHYKNPKPYFLSSLEELLWIYVTKDVKIKSHSREWQMMEAVCLLVVK